MNNLERRALLGDPQAQEECTRRGIVLGCPRCGKGGASTKYVMGDYWYECPHCHSASGFHSSAEVALADWNTRPAPPIGRCGECAYWDKHTGECETAADIEVAYHKYTESDFFCGDFEPKEKNRNG